MAKCCLPSLKCTVLTLSGFDSSDPSGFAGQKISKELITKKLSSDGPKGGFSAVLLRLDSDKPGSLNTLLQANLPSGSNLLEPY